MTDPAAPSAQYKFCSQCGGRNRRTAKVCTKCGHVFKLMALSPVETAPRKACPDCQRENHVQARFCIGCGHAFKNLPADNSADSGDQKWCPRCGMINKLGAKVCIQCGHRFRTRFKPDPMPVETTEKPQVSAGEVAESPITQSPETPLILPYQFERPDVTTLPPPVDIQYTATDNLEGEPAPDLSSAQLDRLREQSEENLDPYEQLKRSLQRRNSNP